jgi:hypothetical protein
MFDVPHESSGIHGYTQALTLKQIQSIHTFGGVFKVNIALDAATGQKGQFSAFETNQATSIVDKNGNQVFVGLTNRRVAASFIHDLIHVKTHPTISYGWANITFDGVETVEVINELGETVVNTVPEILAGDIFDAEVRIVNGFDTPMYAYVNGILVGNPTFDTSGQNQSRLQYSSGATLGGLRHSYIRTFGATVFTENPITIPIRLVGACALLALEFGKFPPNFVGDKEYLENENDYARMQDLPINIQAAVEPFLASYVGAIDDEGIATTDDRKKIPEVNTTLPVEPRKVMKDLEYS